MMQLLEELQEGKGRGEYLYWCELQTSQNGILAAIEAIEGKSWDVTKAEVDEGVREGKTRMERGFVDGAMMLLERMVLYGGLGDMDLWGKHEIPGNDNLKLEQVIRVVMNQNVDGRPDCGCG